MRANPRSARVRSRAAAAPSGREAASAYAAGGEVGELYCALQSRLGDTRLILSLPPLPVEERFVQAVSRTAGWILLAGCFIAAAIALIR